MTIGPVPEVTEEFMADLHAHALRSLMDVPRCSVERPCEFYNPWHLLLYGECFHESED